MSQWQLVFVATSLLFASEAAAFCGFYVSGGDAKLFNEATQVVMMRHGDKTALSMQNNYEGPADGFAMVIPVPQVLQKENVKTLEKASFDKIDQLTAPRLVEYWEQDPCYIEPPMEEFADEVGAPPPTAADGAVDEDTGVKIEAQFKVGEYEIVILSATESTGLDTWLKREKYNVPQGAAPLYKPYIEGGQYFFVAKVDPQKVKYVDGRAILSPLRFDYTSKEFQLPIRLGMINSKGKQDLIVYILAQNQRYEVANYKNAYIPTNIEVANDTRENFGEFYRALFDKTQEATEGVVVTEYSWDASTCDPCPGPTLDQNDYMTFGADALGAQGWGWVVTRLHGRYTKDDIGEDLVFQAGAPIGGGREWRDQETGAIEQGTRPADRNMFQGRYIIRHEWTGKVECDSPQFGRWGGPPEGPPPGVGSAPSPNTEGRAPELKGAPIKLENLLRQDIPEIAVKMGDKNTPMDTKPKEGPSGEVPSEGPKSTCAGCATGGSSGAGLLLAGFGLPWMRRRRGGKR